MIKNAEKLASRYAKSLLEIVLEVRGEKAASDIAQQLKSLSDLERGETGHFFRSPVFDMQEKVQVLESVLKKEPVDPAFDRFLRVLIMMGHIELLVEISDAYTVALREQRNEVQAKLRSAFPLEEKDQARIAKALSKATGKNVQIDVAIDPALIGGVVAEVGGVVYDASIQGYLNRLQEEFAV